MSVEFRVAVSERVRDQIEKLVAGQRSLEHVVHWGLRLDPAALVQDVVVQDEYTHDVVIGHPAGVFLVYDTT